MRKIKDNNFIYCLNIIFKSSPWVAGIFILYSFIIGIIPLLLVKAQSKLIDEAIISSQKERITEETIRAIIYIMVLISIFWMIKAFKSVLKSFLLSKVRLYMLPRVMRKKASLEYAQYENIRICDLIKRISKDTVKNIVATFTQMLLLMSDIIVIVSLFGMLFAYSWKSAIIIIIITIPLSKLAVKSGKANYKVEKENSVLQRIGENMDDIIRKRDYVNERTLFQYSEDINLRGYTNNEKLRAILVKTRFTWFLKMKTSSMIIAIISLGIMVVLLKPLRDGVISIGLFTALVTAVFKLINKLSWELTRVIDSLTKKYEYIGELKLFMKLDEEESEDKSCKNIVFESLEFKNVYFKYPNSKKYVLDGISFKINKGKHYAIIGVNGAGKTTIIKLMLGMYKGYRGEILINGKNLKSISKKNLTEIYSAVFQDYAKYNISFKDNLTLGVQKSDDKRLDFIFEHLDLDKIIVKSDLGLQMELGKLGKESHELSHGQWQKVAIGRALYKSSDIYILDEPCSALDPINEKRLYAKYREVLKEKTTISITHRLGATQIADEIIMINGGKVLKTGTHDDLHKNCKLYREMYDKQKGWYEHE